MSVIGKALCLKLYIGLTEFMFAVQCSGVVQYPSAPEVGTSWSQDQDGR